MIKRYTLTRVGAGPGKAVFECENLVGIKGELVDAVAYDAAIKALKDIFEGMAKGVHIGVLHKLLKAGESVLNEAGVKLDVEDENDSDL